MKVYGLSGKSGTGKSYNAAQLCGRMGIDGIVDDGLFVHNNNIVAGISAKRQSSQIRAIKTAIFTDPAHRQQVCEAIRSTAPDSVLVLGTSDEMVELIIKRLELPSAEKIIHIEEITSAEQREEALHHRNDEGMHVIPAPTFEVKKQFSGFFVDPMKSFRKAEEEAAAEAEYMGDRHAAEKTIVRPTFSYLGKFEISNKVIADLAVANAREVPGIEEVLFTATHHRDDGMYIRVIVVMRYGTRMKDAAEELQRRLAREVAEMTAFNMLGIEVEIRSFRVV